VPTYYYKVVAVNGQSSGPASNEVALTVTNVPPANPCKAPGPMILTDPTGDSVTGAPGTDLKSLELSQPYQTDGSLKLRFELDTDPGQNPQAPNSYWYVSFKNPDGTVHGVRMWFDPSNPTVPTFESYIAAGNTSGTIDGRFVAAGSEKPADPSSSYDPTTGTIVIVASASDLGLTGGDTINGFNSASVQSVSTPAGGLAATVDEMPDGLGYQGSFAVQSNAACFPDKAPTASLTASQASTLAPSKVTFDGSASSDPDAGDHVASYTFNFGDGSPSVTQSTPTITHTYVAAGEHKATLTVKDTHGKRSLNVAFVRIEVVPFVTKYEDNAGSIAYPSGWHTVGDTAASGGHFRLSVGKGLSFPFHTPSLKAVLGFAYGKSTKGGTADLYLDGTKLTTLDFKGSSGTVTEPAFGSLFSTKLAAGAHTLALRNVKGPINVDRITVTDGDTQSQPNSDPGGTKISTGSVKVNGTTTGKAFVPTSATSLAVFVAGLPSGSFRAVLLSPSGQVLAQATSTNGIVSLVAPVSTYGTYRVRIVNTGSKQLQFFSAATPYIKLS
jgi:hypothetical protein